MVRRASAGEVIRPIGNSAGVTMHQKMLEGIKLGLGDKVYLRETAEGVLVTPYDAEFAEIMALAEEGAKN